MFGIITTALGLLGFIISESIIKYRDEKYKALKIKRDNIKDNRKIHNTYMGVGIIIGIIIETCIVIDFESKL